RLSSKADEDWERYDTAPHLVLAVEVGVLNLHVAEALATARARSPMLRLSRELAKPTWFATEKGWRFQTSRGDVVQTYRRRDGGYGYGVQVGLTGEMDWGKKVYYSMPQAKEAGVHALTIALRKAGRLRTLH